MFQPRESKPDETAPAARANRRALRQYDASAPLDRAARSPAFDAHLRECGHPPLARGEIETLQVNLGKLCNMACRHCHVDAGPRRTESMSREIAERVAVLCEASPEVRCVDLTGGAPELNPNFRFLVTQARRLGREVIDRCNLTVLLEPGMAGMGEFLADQRVHVVASLPCYQARNVEAQRGPRAFANSIAALVRLNALGYGVEGSGLELDLVYNPVGPTLPPPQAELESTYKQRLAESHGVSFNRLLTITNMPIARFRAALVRSHELERYVELLIGHFNPHTLSGVMCRSLVSVSWDGRLYDCDFNQMLELEPRSTTRRTVWDIRALAELRGAAVATGTHCFGCTAGAGSSCSGALR